MTSRFWSFPKLGQDIAWNLICDTGSSQSLSFCQKYLEQFVSQLDHEATVHLKKNLNQAPINKFTCGFDFKTNACHPGTKSCVNQKLLVLVTINTSYNGTVTVNWQVSYCHNIPWWAREKGEFDYVAKRERNLRAYHMKSTDSDRSSQVHLQNQTCRNAK